MTITLADHLRNIVRRIAGLQLGRYFIVLSVKPNAVDYSVRRVGPIEVGEFPSLEKLPNGRYVAVITVERNSADYTLQRVGKVEK